MLIWDSLFLILVLAPIAMGGVWIHHPGLHLEYTQPGIAALVLIAFLFWRRPPKSLLLVQFQRFWGVWTRNLLTNPLRTLAIAWTFFSTLWFTTSLFRHRALGSGLADLGIFTNGIWNFSQVGFPYSSLKNGLSLFADHQIFLLYPLAWIFPLWPSPVFLLLLQAFGLCSGAIALFLLGKQKLGAEHPVLPWLPFVYWMCGPIRAANLFDFHPEVFMLPLFLFAIYFLQERKNGKRILGAIFFLAALCAKESAGPVACGVGLAWILGSGNSRFTRAAGFLAAFSGLFFFYFDSQVVPGWLGVTYAYSDLYEPLGSTVTALASSPFLHPSIFFGRLLSVSRLKFFIGLFLPAAFLPLLAPLSLVAALPGLLMLFLTNGDHRISLSFHYAIEPMVGVLMALPVALAQPLAQKWKNHLLPIMIVASLLSFGRSEIFFWRVYQPDAHTKWLREELLPAIPQVRSVSASYGLVPQLATRHWVNQIPYFEDENGNPVECALVDPSVNNTPLTAEAIAGAKKQLEVKKYNSIFACGTFSLYQRVGGSDCLSHPVPCPEAP